jgi:histone H3/H4
MTAALENRRQADEVAGKVDELLNGVDPGPFSAAAFSVLKGKVAEYLGEVTREAAAIARRTKADVISVRDIEAACERLTVSPRKIVFRHLGTIAGLSLGTCGSTLSSMVVAGQFSLWSIVLSIATGLIGAFLLGIHVFKD